MTLIQKAHTCVQAGLAGSPNRVCDACVEEREIAAIQAPDQWEQRLDKMFDLAFRANDGPMLDYVRMKFELHEGRRAVNGFRLAHDLVASAFEQFGDVTPAPLWLTKLLQAMDMMNKTIFNS